MSKDPAVLWYPNDWLGGTLGMSLAEKGAYHELLMLQFNRGHMNEKFIKQTVGKLWYSVKDKFITDDDGLFFNERFEYEIQKRAAHCKKQKSNIEKRWNKSGTPLGNTMVLPLENENEIVINKQDDKTISLERGIVKGVKRSSAEFDLFWTAYPRKVGKAAARKAFEKAAVDVNVLLDAIAKQAASKQWQKNGGEFIPNPSTWLNQGRWEDEVPADKKRGVTIGSKPSQDELKHMHSFLEKLRAED